MKIRKKVKPLEVFNDPYPDLEWLDNLSLPYRFKSLVTSHLKNTASFSNFCVVIDDVCWPIPSSFKELLALTKAYPWAVVERLAATKSLAEPYAGNLRMMTLFDFLRSLIFYAACKKKNANSVSETSYDIAGRLVFSSDAFANLKAHYTLRLLLEIFYSAEVRYLKSHRLNLISNMINESYLSERFTEVAAAKKAQSVNSPSQEAGLLLIVEDNEVAPSFLPDDVIFEAFLSQINLNDDPDIVTLDKEALCGVSAKDIFRNSPKFSLDTLNAKFSSDLMMLNLEVLYPTAALPGHPDPDFSKLTTDTRSQRVYLGIAFKRAAEAHAQLIN